jgi:gas vesicle protein
MARDGAGAGTVMLAFLVGAVAGAAVGLLYAPVTGREYLDAKTREGRERAAQAAAKGREMVTQSREQLSAAIDKGREAYKQARAGESRETA